SNHRLRRTVLEQTYRGDSTRRERFDAPTAANSCPWRMHDDVAMVADGRLLVLGRLWLCPLPTRGEDAALGQRDREVAWNVRHQCRHDARGADAAADRRQCHGKCLCRG